MLRQIVSAVGSTLALGCVVVIGSTVAWSNIVVPPGQAYASKAEFERAFADLGSLPQSLNTAPNREKLRAIGWQRLNATLASK